jgi:hypothetical protein
MVKTYLNVQEPLAQIFLSNDALALANVHDLLEQFRGGNGTRRRSDLNISSNLLDKSFLVSMRLMPHSYLMQHDRHQGHEEQATERSARNGSIG